MPDTFEPYEGREPYIFVSYCHRDGDAVVPLLGTLARAGYRVWYDEGIPWTVEWPRKIAERLDGCAVCLAFHSAASAVSRHCIAELHRALSKERNILSVYLEEGVRLDSGLEMYLALIQSVKRSEFADAEAFAARLGREAVFAPCKAPAWNKIGQIQWKWDPSSGLLTIAQNEDLRWWRGSIPPYQDDPIHDGSTAPWMPYREQIRSVEIKDDIDEIGDYAFAHCAGLTSVTIPDSVDTIGEYAFWGCAGLTSVTIGDSVISIGRWAFAGCAGLTSVTIPDSVTAIGNRAFSGCAGLTSVTIPDSVTAIGERAFAGCAGLTSVTIPDSVTSIGDGAFAGCAGLTSVTIPAEAELGDVAFPEHTQIVRRPPA